MTARIIQFPGLHSDSERAKHVLSGDDTTHERLLASNQPYSAPRSANVVSILKELGLRPPATTCDTDAYVVPHEVLTGVSNIPPNPLDIRHGCGFNVGTTQV